MACRTILRIRFSTGTAIEKMPISRSMRITSGWNGVAPWANHVSPLVVLTMRYTLRKIIAISAVRIAPPKQPTEPPVRSRGRYSSAIAAMDRMPNSTENSLAKSGSEASSRSISAASSGSDAMASATPSTALLGIARQTIRPRISATTPTQQTISKILEITRATEFKVFTAFPPVECGLSGCLHHTTGFYVCQYIFNVFH